MAKKLSEKQQDEKEQDRRQDKKQDQKKKDNPTGTQTKTTKQGRWRTVATEKVPPAELQQPQEDYVEHRPLGY